MKISVWGLAILVSGSAFAFIPRATLILQKTAENSGAGIYQIEQEVQFPTLQEPLVLKEVWTVQNEDTMKLVVTGVREWKDQIKLVYVYQNGYRYFQTLLGKYQKKLNEDFIEKYFHFRKGEDLASTLVAMKIVPASIMAKRTVRLTKEPDYKPDPNVRISRTGGVLDYAFGAPSMGGSETNLPPGFWIEQDQFVVRKFRLPSQVEVTADRFGSYAHGMNFPRTRSIHWGDNHVSIQTIQVQARPSVPKLFDSSALEVSTRIDLLDGLPNKNLIEEFYKRFR